MRKVGEKPEKYRSQKPSEKGRDVSSQSHKVGDIKQVPYHLSFGGF